LKEEVLKWPEKWETIFMVSVDGVHFHLKEPTSKEYKFLSEYFSHKFYNGQANKGRKEVAQVAME
jgi:surfactin synthase thioesterase subunit